MGHSVKLGSDHFKCNKPTSQLRKRNSLGHDIRRGRNLCRRRRRPAPDTGSARPRGWGCRAFAIRANKPERLCCRRRSGWCAAKSTLS